MVGERITPLDYEAFADINLKLFKDDNQIETGHSSEVLGNPIESVKWLNKNYILMVNQKEDNLFLLEPSFLL